MNRIYQGRVSTVEILKLGAKGNKPDDWQPFDPADSKRECDASPDAAARAYSILNCPTHAP